MNRLLAAWVVGSLIVVGAAVIGCGPSMHKLRLAQNHRQQAAGLVNKGEFALALKELDAARELQPNDPELFALFGLCYFGKKEYGDAEIAFKRAILGYSRSRDDVEQVPVAQNNLCGMYLELGNWNGAIEMCEKAIANDYYRTPDRAINNLGWAYFKRGEPGDLTRAESYFRQAIEANRTFSVPYNNLGILLMKKKEYAQAKKTYLQAIKLYPDYAEAYYNVGLAYIALKQKREGLMAFRTCVKKGGYEKQCENALNLYRLK